MEAMAKIKVTGIEDLKKCPDLKTRYKKLKELLPEILSWEPIVVRKLVFHIHHIFHIKLGVCKYYTVDDYKQYCLYGGVKYECLCAIPQKSCVIRDRKRKSKHPKLILVRS